MKLKYLEAISLRVNKPLVSRCRTMAIKLLGNYRKRVDKLGVCLGSELGVTFRVSVFLLRFKVHRADVRNLRIIFFIFYVMPIYNLLRKGSNK